MVAAFASVIMTLVVGSLAMQTLSSTHSLTAASKQMKVKGRFTDSDSSSCDGTVAYVFLVREDIPLKSVWQKYFSSCPTGSYTVLVHAQNQSASLSASLSSLGATLLGPGHTVNGELRFSYGMVDAMFELYTGVKHGGKAPNGCTPSWVHLSSDSCAPVAPCSQVHDHLKQHPYASFVAQAPPGEFTKGTLADINVKRSSQWVTLWADHARALAEDETAIRNKWEHRQHNSGDGGLVYIGGDKFLGALDEYVVVNEMRARKFPIVGGGVLTESLWAAPAKPGDKFTSSPDTASTAAEARKLIDAAKGRGKLFARKFDADQQVVSLLMSYVDESQYSADWLVKNANHRYVREIKEQMSN